MDTLRSTVAAALPDIAALGGGDRTVNRDRLIDLLDGLARELKRAYWIRLVIALCVLAVLAVLMFRVADRPALLASVTGGAGITVGGAVAALKQVTDEMARVRLLLAIVP